MAQVLQSARREPIEEQHERGENLRDAPIDAGILRIRARTDHGRSNRAGPASAGSPRRSAVGGALLCADRRLSLATLVTLFIVPVIYSIFVLDLKVIK